jgi:hypothetical protein
MSNKTEYLAFNERYGQIVPELKTPIKVSPVSTLTPALKDTSVMVNAIWDTGATCTVITHELQRQLNLYPVRKAIAKGVNSITKTDMVIISITLPNGAVIQGVTAMVADINSDGSHVLIGMDVITLGDFSISNTDSETVFSFAIPPFKERLTLVERAAAANQQCAE